MKGEKKDLMANNLIATNKNKYNSKVKRFMLLVALVAATGGFLFGFDTGVISGALIFIDHMFHPTVLQKSLIVSSTVLGAFFGSIFSGGFVNKLGRKLTLLYCSITFIIGTLLCAFATSVNIMIIGRFILGIAIGIASYTVPLYIAEISTPNKRGKMIMFNGVAITGAQAVSFLSDYYFSHTYNWRMMLGVAVVPAIILLIGTLFLPESPRWLILRKQKNHALIILNKIRNIDYIEQEVNEIEESFKIKQGGFKELLSKKMRPILIIGIVLGIMQQFTGINTIMYYGPYIFEKIGFTGDSARIFATFGMGVVNCIASIFVMFTVDRLGRKKLMIIGMIIAMLSLFILSIIVPAIKFFNKILSIFLLGSYITGFAISIGSLFWVIISEIYPLKIRSIGMSFVGGIQWFANFFISMTFLPVLELFGIGINFRIYALMCLFVIIFTKYYVPETKGVSLETIAKILEKNNVRLETSNTLMEAE